MTTAHIVVGSLVIALSLLAGAWGGWRWYRVAPSAAFWRLLRAAQVALLVQILLGAVLLALGRRPSSDLHFLYGLLPLGISFIAEQLRVASADMVLQARGHDSAREVGKLAPEEQRAVVMAIVQREMGVMVVAALVIFGLALRAAFTGG